MSRIAKKPILIPAGVTVTVDGKTVMVKGKAGTLERTLSRFVNAQVDGSTVVLSTTGNSGQAKASWGAEAAHIRNMMAGSEKAYERTLIMEGVGFKVVIAGKKMTFSLGFSHPIIVTIPEALTVTTEKGEIKIVGINKDEVGQFAANIRKLKEPEPYKGKGIRYSDEVVRRKQGKRAV
jgi:large subunit ribosomal protein L6